jgi:signal transduction histidine kinase/ligand-binding sensor domain-containing protein
LRNSNTSLSGWLRRDLVLALATTLVLLGLAAQLHALDPARTLSHYMRERWGTDRGFPGGAVSALAQTSDGYLWIGTAHGLVRFDGLTFTTFRQVPPTLVPMGPVQALLTDSEDNLWILLQSTKILRYHKGSFELGHDEAEVGITAISRRNDGAVLFCSLAYGTLTYSAGKFAILPSSKSNGSANSAAAETNDANDTLSSRFSWATGVASHRLADPDSAVVSMAETDDGKLWLGTQDRGLFSVVKGRISAIAKDRMGAKVTCLLPMAGGKLWIATETGMMIWDGTKLTQTDVPEALRPSKVLAMIRDRDANVWLGTSAGLVRVNAAGLSFEGKKSSGPVTALFEDREGNLWAGGPQGIERMRDGAFVTYSVRSLQSDSSGPIYVDQQGRAWFAPFEGGLHWLKDEKSGSVENDGLSQDVVYSITGGKDGLWVGRQRGGLTHLQFAGSSLTAKTYTQANGLAQNGVYAVFQGKDRSVWAATLSAGVSQFANGRFITYSKGSGMSSNTVTSMAEGSDGTMWFATANGLNAFSNGQWRVFTAHDGLPSENINCLLSDSAGVLWIGTTSGPAFLQTGRVESLSAAPASLREPILGIAEARNGQLWIATANHVLSVPRQSLLDGVLRDTDLRIYGVEDGLLGTEGVKRERSVFADDSGRVWFSLDRGLSVIDTTRALGSSPPATVQIESISVDGSPMDPAQFIRVPPGSHRITFNYSGLSLSVPERVRFRYLLDNFDRNWSEPTAAREAVYTNLGPGPYQFRLLASDSNGTWRGSEAALAFKVDPAFWQTWWFRVSSVLVIALIMLAFFRSRELRLTKQLNMRFEERLAERTRIARDLHDTLLQGFLSASMQLHVVADQLPPDFPSKPVFDRVLELMARVIDEGRNALGGLRSSPGGALDLGQALSQIQQEFPENEERSFHVIVEGSPRSLHPVIRDEIYSIGREALTNAFRHSRATSIEVELEYASHQLRVLVRDSGVGFDEKVVKFGRDGHFGLSGMRERAKKIGSKLRVLSRPGGGTEVELCVPGHTAFVRPASASAANWLSKWWPREKKVLRESSRERNG